jgi:vesicle-fusing ATPase
MWALPLLRLDLSTVYSGVFGNAEASLQRAVSVAEAVAPCVLWIDKIEKGIAGIGTGETGTIARVFGAFLTGRQEKTSPVFVAATANMIDLLPAEVVRKGRPTTRSSSWICPRRGNALRSGPSDLKRGDYPKPRVAQDELAKITDQWTASEVEQAGTNATLTALVERREPTDRDLLQALGTIVPLARTLSERIREIRRRASDRAAPASSASQG